MLRAPITRARSLRRLSLLSGTAESPLPRRSDEFFSSGSRKKTLEGQQGVHSFLFLSDGCDGPVGFAPGPRQDKTRACIVYVDHEKFVSRFRSRLQPSLLTVSKQGQPKGSRRLLFIGRPLWLKSEHRRIALDSRKVSNLSPSRWVFIFLSRFGPSRRLLSEQCCALPVRLNLLPFFIHSLI